MSSSPKKKGGFRWDDVRILDDDLNTMMMEIIMMMKYDDDERIGRRIRGRRSRPDSGAAGEAEGIWRRPRWGRRIQDCVYSDLYFFEKTSVFRRRRFSENYKSSAQEVPDFGFGRIQSARATSPPRTDRFGVHSAGDIPELGLRSCELVSLR